MSRILALTLLLVTAVPVRAAQDLPFRFQTRDVADYGVVGGAVATFGLLHLLTPPEGAGIGPSFDPKNPSAILAPQYRDKLGRVHLHEDIGEMVPALWVGLAIPAVAGGLALDAAMPAWVGGTAAGRRVHDNAVGVLEATAVTLAAVEVLKLGFGRLRPDFQDRVRRHYCTGTADMQASVDCTGGPYVPLDPNPKTAQKIFDDGRRSFPSGHSSTSFALATFAALAIGGHWVWGDDAGDLSWPVGIAAQTALVAAATFVTASRIDDGRHHTSDALTGAAIGFGVAQMAYWRRFDVQGRPRRATGAAYQSAGLSLTDNGIAVRVGW
jgi:membrane-associated phospholipid phosphatase